MESGDYEDATFAGSDGRRLVVGFAILALLGAAFFGTRLFREFTDGETNHSPKPAPAVSTAPGP